eukprot:CAMPEP_0197602184 /NCGR_PEP_ID=MMETSP1326-20131121/36749_1 /TAXON_ID=1155430 /ORGANISM="Genus nov. species nov., Strain RCC2288" /LENGTH=44 /DNA_ID= /DNA_START= /DNA_END= /DNA_ORIENTATION=
MSSTFWPYFNDEKNSEDDIEHFLNLLLDIDSDGVDSSAQAQAIP